MHGRDLDLGVLGELRSVEAKDVVWIIHCRARVVGLGFLGRVILGGTSPSVVSTAQDGDRVVVFLPEEDTRLLVPVVGFLADFRA